MAEKFYDKDLQELGMDKKYLGMLSYLIIFIGGAIFYFVSKDKFVRFHALQSIMFFVGSSVISFIIFYLGFYVPLAFLIKWIVSFILIIVWLTLIISAYNGKKIKLPFIGEIAEEFSTKEII